MNIMYRLYAPNLENFAYNIRASQNAHPYTLKNKFQKNVQVF